MQHGRAALVVAYLCELLDARERVERVAAQESNGGLDGLARALVLVAPVLAGLRLTRRLEVEMRCPPCGACGARENHAQHVGVLVLGGQVAEREELGRRARCIPALQVRLLRDARSAHVEIVETRARAAQVGGKHIEVVARGLDSDQQAVERGELDAGCVASRLEGLHERRAGARERVEHMPAGRDVAIDEHLDELRDELAVIRVQAVDVPGAHVLRQCALRPRELEVQRRVQLVLCNGHEARTSTAGPEALVPILQPACVVAAAPELERLVRELGVCRLLRDAGAVPLRGGLRRVDETVVLRPGPSADGEHDRRSVARADDRVVDPRRAVEEIPARQRALGAVDDQQALACEHEEVLLRVLTVVHRHRLAGREDVEVDAELREARLAALEPRVLAEIASSQRASFALRTNQPSPSGT